MSKSCPRCGASMPDTAKFCTTCGTPLPQQPQQPQRPPQQSYQQPPQQYQQPRPQQPPYQQPPQQYQQPPYQQPPQQYQQPPQQPYRAPGQQPPYQAPPPQYQQPQPPQYQPPQPPQPPVYQHPPAAPAPEKKSKKGLIIGLSIGGAALIALIIVLIIVLGGDKDKGKGNTGETNVHPSPIIATNPDSKPTPIPVLPQDTPDGPSGDPITLPTWVPDVSYGMVYVQSGGLALAVPGDYIISGDLDELDIEEDSDYSLNYISLMQEARDEDDDLEEAIRSIKDDVPFLTVDRPITGTGYSGRFLSGEFSENGYTCYASCYIILCDDRIYGALFMSDGTDPRVAQAQSSLAFDPRASYTEFSVPSPTATVDPTQGNYQSTEHATLSDFYWAIYEEGLIPEGFPEDFEEVRGQWKACIYYSFEDIYDICDVILYGDADNTYMDLMYLYYQYGTDGEVVDVSDFAPEWFQGTFSDDTINVSGTYGTIEAGYFFYSEGKQYFEGVMSFEDGWYAMIYMVRP